MTEEIEQGYRSPGEDIEALVDAPNNPLFRPSPNKRHAALLDYALALPLERLAQPFIKLAGMRIDTRSASTRSSSHVFGMRLIDLTGEGDLPKEREVRFPQGFKRISSVSWSPNSQMLAISAMCDDDTLKLLLLDVETLEVTEPLGRAVRLNDVLANEIRWLPGGRELLVMAIPEDRGEAPMPPLVPHSPIMQESRGRTASVRTYQDLLENAHDEALLKHYGTSQIILLDIESGEHRMFGPPGLYSTPRHSPDGSLVLVRRVTEPFSYSVPLYYFGSKLEVWDATSGEVVHEVADLPIADAVPPMGVRTGPRSVQWQPLEPAQLFWTEALDGGDPLAKVDHREQLMLLDLSEEHASAQPWRKLKERLSSVMWLDVPGKVMISEYERERRWATTYLCDTSDSEAEPKVLFDRSVQDRYNASGSPLAKRRLDMTSVAIVEDDGDTLYMVGPGASAKGDRPVIDKYSIASGERLRLFESSAHAYEAPLGFGPSLGGERTLLISRETPTLPPSVFRRTFDTEAEFEEGDDLEEIRLTEARDPHPDLTGVHRELLRYEREDGLPLSGTLYLPKDYDESEPLPVVIAAYPLEYRDASMAGQVRAQPTSFTRFRMSSPLMFLTRGYAVLNEATMPVVGDVETMNETFVEQITQAASAAIDAVVDRGVAERHRVGVMGHSYGAFMTANLLAHTDLFQAGIARSGAYNRSLTPFGFQGERRSLWEAGEMYTRLSPFFHADKITAPLLLIHGEEDPNSGTFPLQSKRLFHAIKGLGGTARLVLLPHEGHGYRSRESVLHVLAEQFDWFEEFVKEATPPGDEEE